MTKNLIVPIAGKSTRFPGMRPKWMLTHPNGDFMAIAAISGLNLDFFDKIYFVALEEHEHQYYFYEGFEENLQEKGLLDKSTIILLSKETQSQPETIYEAITKADIQGFIFIKDCDNYFNLNIQEPKNQVAYSSLKDFTHINPNNKSYILLDEKNVIENIIEKEILSTTFCVGGYGFEDAQEFCQTYEKLSKLQDKDLYVSDIIFDMILRKKLFYGSKCEKYSDWGDLASWSNYCNSFKTLFLDIDGNLVKNSSKHFPPYIGESEGLPNNIKLIQDLYKTGRAQIILTTSRPESSRQITVRQLEKLEIPYNHLIMGLLSSTKRYLVNDYSSNSNPFPTAIAINLERDKDNLGNYL